MRVCRRTRSAFAGELGNRPHHHRCHIPLASDAAASPGQPAAPAVGSPLPSSCSLPSHRPRRRPGRRGHYGGGFLPRRLRSYNCSVHLGARMSGAFTAARLPSGASAETPSWTKSQPYTEGRRGRADANQTNRRSAGRRAAWLLESGLAFSRARRRRQPASDSFSERTSGARAGRGMVLTCARRGPQAEKQQQQ